jgi:hypothetical protein
MKNLKGILKNGFSPRYCPEYTIDPVDTKLASKRCPPMHALPMVCFCDLPLALIGKHLNEYGGFGIGLLKTWGVNNGVEPVSYTHRKGQTRRPMSRIITNAAKDNGRFANDVNLLVAYRKPYKGNAWRERKRPEFRRAVPF